MQGCINCTVLVVYCARTPPNLVVRPGIFYCLLISFSGAEQLILCELMLLKKHQVVRVAISTSPEPRSPHGLFLY